MAEHDERNFEHEISEKLKMLDKNIKIPEIPDAQGIFEKAETKKENTVPFKKYSKYVAVAAAVVLICIGAPVMADALSGGLDLASEAADESYHYSVFDGVTADSAEPESEIVAEANGDSEEDGGETVAQTEPETPNEDEKNTSSGEAVNKTNLSLALTDYFRQNSTASSSAASSSMEDGDDLSVIDDYINKKRSIEITVEKDSVSIVLFDNSAGEEIINAFWVEGTFESSYLSGDYYVINISYPVTQSDLEGGYYLPMIGDTNGTYTISEENVFIPEKVTKGVISLCIEVDVGTGEYRIYASLV